MVYIGTFWIRCRRSSCRRSSLIFSSALQYPPGAAPVLQVDSLSFTSLHARGRRAAKPIATMPRWKVAQKNRMSSIISRGER